MTGELATEIKRLGDEIAQLQAGGAIGRLMRRYAQLCDDGYDGDAIAALFTEDGSWLSNHDGPHVGRPAIAAFLGGVGSTRFSWAAHYLANEVVDVDLATGTASGSWSLVQLATDRRAEPGPAASVVATGRYRNRFVQREGEWLLADLELDLHWVTDVNTGW